MTDNKTTQNSDFMSFLHSPDSNFKSTPKHEQFAETQKTILSKKTEVQGILESAVDLDSTLNFRVNSKLKAEFERICKVDHSSASREIKRFMSAIVRAQKIIEIPRH